jgi:hypothetical protein
VILTAAPDRSTFSNALPSNLSSELLLAPAFSSNRCSETGPGGWEWLLPLRHEDDHDRGSPSQNGTDDHLRTNGSTTPVLALSEAHEGVEDDHQRDVIIFDAIERARRFDALYPPKATRTS